MGNFLGVQWFELCASSVGDMGSIPSLGTKIPHTVQRSQRERKILVVPSMLQDF